MRIYSGPIQEWSPYRPGQKIIPPKPSHKDIELPRSSLKKRTQRKYRQGLPKLVDYFMGRKFEVYNTARLDEFLDVYIHYMFKDPDRDGERHANMLLCTVKLYLPETETCDTCRIAPLLHGPRRDPSRERLRINMT